MPPFSPSGRPDFRDFAVLWRKNEYLASPVGQDEQLVTLRGATPVLLPGFVVDFLTGCDVFRSMDVHVRAHAERYAWGTLEIESLRSWLAPAAACGALISSADVFAAISSDTRASYKPAVLDTIGFPTGGDRTDMVGRAVASFARNAAEHDRAVRFLVSDGSANLTHRTAFREASCRWAGEHRVEILYAGEEEKRRLLRELVRRGCDEEAVEFALFDPLEIGFTCGANRNALLLHQAGRAFCSVDDDVICQLAAAPTSAFRLRLFSGCDPFSRWLFPTSESAVAHAGGVKVDFFATHEALLGLTLHEVGGGLRREALDLSLVGDDFLRRLWSGSGQIRASFSGYFGDPGIPTSTYYLFYEGENRARLTANERDYRGILASRNVFTVSPCAGVGDSSACPGMAMALDHRELLPPFFPVLHAEDFIYGATLWLCDSHAFLGHSPVAVRHAPRAGKTILQPSELGGDRRAVIFEFAHLIRRVLLRFHHSESAPIDVRMRQLGSFLRTVVEQPLVDFVEMLRSQIVEQESARLDYLEQQLREDTESPQFWRDDLQAYVEHLREGLTHDDFDIPFDLKGSRGPEENRQLIRELFARYGRLLEAWPDIVATAKAINAEGEWAEVFRV